VDLKKVDPKKEEGDRLDFVILINCPDRILSDAFAFWLKDSAMKGAFVRGSTACVGRLFALRWILCVG